MYNYIYTVHCYDNEFSNNVFCNTVDFLSLCFLIKSSMFDDTTVITVEIFDGLWQTLYALWWDILQMN